MGNTCCETIPGHTIIDSLNNLTQFADYEPSHFPSEDSYFLEHVQS